MANNFHEIESSVEGISLIRESKVVDASQVLSLFPGQRVFVCDAYVHNIQNDGTPIAGGFQLGQLLNIDHHAPVEVMQRRISSAPLAIQYVRAHGPANTNDAVVVNHFDADSALSSCIIRGVLPPDDAYGQAAIAADHTGEMNDLADLLQLCGSQRDLEFSLRNMRLLLAGKPLEPSAQALLEKQRNKRQEARKIVEQGRFNLTLNGVAWIYLEDKIDGVFFPALLPEAKLITIASPLDDSRNLRIGQRLGLAAGEGSSLYDLKIDEFDPAYGGRWNAGNNSRAGGTGLPLEEYVAALDQRVAEKFL